MHQLLLILGTGYPLTCPLAHFRLQEFGGSGEELATLLEFETKLWFCCHFGDLSASRYLRAIQRRAIPTQLAQHAMVLHLQRMQDLQPSGPSEGEDFDSLVTRVEGQAVDTARRECRR